MAEMCGKDMGPKAKVRPNRTLRPCLTEPGEGASYSPVTAGRCAALGRGCGSVRDILAGGRGESSATQKISPPDHFPVPFVSVSFRDWGSCSLKLRKNPLNINVYICFPMCYRKTQLSEPRPSAFHSFLLLQQVRD